MVGFLLMMMAGGVGVVGAWFVWQNRKDDLEVVGEDGDQDIAEDEKDSKEGKKKGKKGRKNENVENEEEGNGKKKNAK
ncbi:hypothetical protein CC78DRAFT_537216 [Lojkania enalia]|uniref:Uncharacterized protein n=1 Tax=Lojkania enalia TaxID=147567 RepID=A0A9P4JY28_9PLEO|nr:hypothetical protein CC78DRAFT_537216 [Didymosphaeria enalia]